VKLKYLIILILIGLYLLSCGNPVAPINQDNIGDIRLLLTAEPWVAGGVSAYGTWIITNTFFNNGHFTYKLVYDPFSVDRFSFIQGQWKLKEEGGLYGVSHVTDSGINYTLTISRIDENWLVLGGREYRRESQWTE